MRKVSLEHSEVLNETEVLLVFTTTFNRKQYATYTIINTVEKVELQDDLIEQAVTQLADMKREDARNAKEIE